jgi:hypothetical protein
MPLTRTSEEAGETRLAQHARFMSARARLWGPSAKRRPIVVAEKQPPETPQPVPFIAVEEGPCEDYAPFDFYKPPSARAVVKLVSLKHGVHPRDIVGANRFRRTVAARHHAIWLVHTHCPWLSLPDVGRLFGRDHTTILYAISKVTGKRVRADA